MHATTRRALFTAIKMINSGSTQAEAAAATEISESTITRYIRDQRKKAAAATNERRNAKRRKKRAAAAV